jgi:hypothetical protein
VVLWVIITVLGAMNMVETGFFLTVALTVCYGILGAIHGGSINKKILLYPILLWVVLMVISIVGMNYYQDRFSGIRPAFTILGLHPSFAFVVFFNWIGGILTWTAGFYIFRNEWLSENAWNNFMKEIKRIDAIEGAKHE